MASLVALSLFSAQLLRLQALDASTMAEQAFRNRLRDVKILAPRGTIYDADGAELASSVDRVNVTVDQRAVAQYTVRQNGKKVVVGAAGAAEALAPVLGMDVPTLTGLLTGKRGFQYVMKGITPEKWREVSALDIPGVLPEKTTQRIYPAGEVGASLVGFVGGDGQARGGLELMLDKELTGTGGSMRYERAPDGRMIPTGEQDEIPAVPGKNVRLTIHRDLQWMAQNAIATKVKQAKALSGVVVVLEVKTGNILALATSPTFDPNAVGSAGSDSLVNRALSDVYEPGSTGKVMTAAAALQEGVVTPTTPFVVPGELKRAGKVFHDAEPHGQEHLTFAGVLAKSSNIGTIMAGEKVPPSVMHDYFVRFGIGQPSGLKFPGESRGILAKVTDWSGSQRYTVLFGQGLSVNALQAAEVFETIANDGVRMPPRLVAGTQDATGHLDPAPAGQGVRVVDASVAQQVRLMLEGVVSNDGTAPEARIPGYRVAGKTGTAQRYDPKCSCYNGYTGSFIGMAPADKPEIVVGVTLQRPQNGYFGGVVAAPVFRDVMTYALQELKVPPTGTKSPTIEITAH